MSANNYILIQKEPRDYVVTHRDADTHKINGLKMRYETLEEAVRYAQKLVRECEEDGYGVEYGIRLDI